MLRRLLARELAEVAGKMPIVTVTGPRQSGKTTLVREVFSDVDYSGGGSTCRRSRTDGACSYTAEWTAIGSATFLWSPGF